MNVVLLHNATSEDALIQERDVLVQRDAVGQALAQHGHRTESLACTLDLRHMRHRLRQLRPDVVFNLVEALGGSDRLMALATLVLDATGIPYTGAPTEALLLSGNKVAAKSVLRQHGLPTPAWRLPGGAGEVWSPPSSMPRSSRWIIKPIWEHASFGIDDQSVVALDQQDALNALLWQREQQAQTPYFAEHFVEGREFNLSLLAADSGAISDTPRVLPPAEIDFSAFPSDKPRIVGHRAKWEEHSFEYRHTPRSFEFATSDAFLLQELSQLAERCWTVMSLRGFARVDFRVDRQGRPWILEVNANPCLSPDAGFAAALSRAGIAYASAIECLVQNARQQRQRSITIG